MALPRYNLSVDSVFSASFASMPCSECLMSCMNLATEWELKNMVGPLQGIESGTMISVQTAVKWVLYPKGNDHWKRVDWCRNLMCLPSLQCLRKCFTNGTAVNVCSDCNVRSKMSWHTSSGSKTFKMRTWKTKGSHSTYCEQMAQIRIEKWRMHSYRQDA